MSHDPRRKKTEYEKLRDKWYKKLSKVKDDVYPDGFQDIESDEYKLKDWSYKFAAKDAVLWQAKATYYQMAASFLEEYKFSNKVEQIIWEYHANGIGVRDIARTLNKLRLFKTNRTTVWQIIQRLKASMYNMYMAKLTEYHE